MKPLHVVCWLFLLWTTNIYQGNKMSIWSQGWSQMLGSSGLKTNAVSLVSEFYHFFVNLFCASVLIIVSTWLWSCTGREWEEESQRMSRKWWGVYTCVILTMNFFYPVFVPVNGFLNSAREPWHHVTAWEQSEDNRNVVCALCWGLVAVFFQFINQSPEKPCS